MREIIERAEMKLQHRQKVVEFSRNSDRIFHQVRLTNGTGLSRVRINKTWTLVLVGLFLLAICGKAFPQTDPTVIQKDGLGMLRVLSMHRMSEAEIRAHPDDYLGARVVLTLRYESPKDQPVYLYAPPNCPPEGYLVKRTGDKVEWFAALVNGTQGSPGFLKLQREIGKGWIFLPPNSAIEWETKTQSTSLGSENAWSVFVRGHRETSPHEVLSTWFKTSDLK